MFSFARTICSGGSFSSLYSVSILVKNKMAVVYVCVVCVCLHLGLLFYSIDLCVCVLGWYKGRDIPYFKILYLLLW